MFDFNSVARSDFILTSDSFGSLEDTKKRPKNQWCCSPSVPLLIQWAIWFGLLLHTTAC